jgi:ligand-binding sensor domain-containing protein
MDVSTGVFRTFRNDPARPDSLSSNAVTSVFEDSRGAIWIGTYQGGLNRFEARTETFTHYRHDAADLRSLSGDIVTTLAEGPAGVLWWAPTAAASPAPSPKRVSPCGCATIRRTRRRWPAIPSTRCT